MRGGVLLLGLLLCLGQEAVDGRKPRKPKPRLAPHRVAAAALPIGSADAQLHHLFSTPLLIVNLTARGVALAELDELALGGFKIVADSAELQADIAKSNRLGRNVPVNNAFFYWQMAQRHCAAGIVGANQRCNNRRWDEYLQSSAVEALQTELQGIVVDYLGSVGIVDVPEFEVRVWANVQSIDTIPLGLHEHTTNGNCICSGTFYTSVPGRSGALRFHDQRARMTEDMDALKLLPGEPHDHKPEHGQLLVFPPWQMHEVLPFEVMTDGYRVSWAFNAIAKEPDNMAVQHMLRDIPYHGNRGVATSGGALADPPPPAVRAAERGAEAVAGDTLPAEPEAYTKEALATMNAKQLKALLKENGLDVKGTKNTLVERLLAAGATQQLPATAAETMALTNPEMLPLSQLLRHLQTLGVPEIHIDRAFGQSCDHKS